jgi:AAA+ ATPase superfamily predicted ATPase
MEVLGRENEIERLQQITASKKAEFVAVYGRRRVGKTFLIRECFNNEFCFYATGLAKANTQKQLTSFTIFINQSFKREYATFHDWLEAFNILIKELKKCKGEKIIFLDELPWFDTKKSDFLTGLEFFWNSWASAQPDVKLIVCGSATSWIINKLIKNKGGLHNRLTARIKLEPFTLHETEMFLQSKDIALDRYQIVQLYMVMGGIPYYLDHVQKGLSAAQNIQLLCFEKDGLLKSEFTFIFSSLFANASQHETIIRKIVELGSGANRDDIIASANLSTGGHASSKLNELEESGFITAYPTYGVKSSKKTYSVSDFYTLFYLRFIERGHKNSTSDWLYKIDDPAIKTWAGITFEQVCLQHTAQIKNALKISGVSSQTSTWQAIGDSKIKGAQIDLIIDRKDRIINLCEIKFSINPFTITKKYDMELRNKISAFKKSTKTKKAVFLTMITTYGLVKNEYSRSIIQNEITMDDFFAKV